MADEDRTPTTPRVLISYAHGTSEHRELVLDFYHFLRSQGLDARIDVVAAAQRQNWPVWMERQLDEADFVLVIASPEYKIRAGTDPPAGVGHGVRWESRMLRDRIHTSPDWALHSVVPVILPGRSATELPAFLQPGSESYYTVESFTAAGADQLLRLLTRQPYEAEPPLGTRPELPARRSPWVPDPNTHFPADIPDFINRSGEIAAVLEHLRGRTSVVVIQGMGGVGKSKLAIHLAHRLYGERPAKLLHVDLQDADHGPLSAAEALGLMLVSAGRQADGTESERRIRWLDAVGNDRAILVLDNASSLRQVAPLIPHSRSCSVLITSRSPIGVDGATFVALDPFDHGSARALIKRIAGALEEAEYDSLIHYCSRLPIALRAVGVRLSRTSPESLLRTLRDEKTRLRSLRIAEDDLDVHACLIASYRFLSTSQRRSFALLAAIPGADFGVTVAATVLGRSVAEAAGELDDLVLASVLEHGGRGRYRFHDLYRLVSRRIIADEGIQLSVRDAAATAVAWYEGAVRQLAAHRRADGVPEQDSLQWLDLEAGNVQAAMTLGRDLELHSSTANLGHGLNGYLVYRGLVEEAVDVLTVALNAAEKLPDLSTAIDIAAALADVLGNLGRPEEAVGALDRLLAQDLTDLGRSALLAYKGARLREMADHSGSVSILEEALRAGRSHGDDLHTAWLLNYLGLAYEMAQRHDDALAAEHEAQKIYERAGDLAGVRWVAMYRSHTLENLGRHDEAETALLWALSTLSSGEEPAAEASILQRLCTHLAARGAVVKLRVAAERYLRVAERMDNIVHRQRAGDFLARATPPRRTI